ncbi:hypothetical protein [Acinetobacter sp. YH01024]|uniref:hypothetical protein n=1 Tax=Acinetobacter sp. YH01024 TaxID=2601037 RepID=UPI0015D1A886|nr:hypothetical protein [Acinetobacter sp. YH01024]
MKSTKFFFSIFLFVISNTINAQTPSNKEIDQLILQHNARSLKFFNEYLHLKKTQENHNILIEKLCRSQEAVNDVMYNSIKYPNLENSAFYLQKSKELNYLLDEEFKDLGATETSCYQYMFNN